MDLSAPKNVEQQVSMEAAVNVLEDQHAGSENLNQPYLSSTDDKKKPEQVISRLPPKAPKSGRRPTKPRPPVSTRREKRPISETPQWSSVSFTVPPQNHTQKLDRSTLKPRVWTSSRKELVSTFVELAGSEHTSDISWTATDMPIIILEDATVMLERPSNISDELYMDVIFVREFVYATPGPSLQTNNIPEGETPVLTTEGKQENVDAAGTATPNRGNQLNKESTCLPDECQSSSSNTALYSTTPLGQSASTIKPTSSRPKANLARRSRGTKVRHSSTPHAVPTSVSVEKPKPPVLPKPKSVISSLKFKKVKIPLPNVNQNASQSGDPSPPCDAPSISDSVRLQELTLGAVRATPPTKHMIPTPLRVDPYFPHYPDNRRLSEFTKAFDNLEPRKKDFLLPLGSFAGSMISKDDGLFDDLCRCSRFNYSRSCRVCGDGGNILDRFMPAFRLPDDPFSRSDRLQLPLFPYQAPCTGVGSINQNIASREQDISARDVMKNALTPSTAGDQGSTTRSSTTGKSDLSTIVPSYNTPASIIENDVRDINPEQPRIINPSTPPVVDLGRQHSLPGSPHNTSPEVVFEDGNQDGFPTKRKREEKAHTRGIELTPGHQMVDIQTNKRRKSDVQPVISQNQNAAVPSGTVHDEPTLNQDEKDGVPSRIPIELQALVDSYISSTAVGIFASRYHLEQFWHLNLDDEISHAFMGLYRICRVWQALRSPPGEQLNTEKGTKNRKGQVEWRFRMKWEPGGEGWQPPEIQEQLESPWWNASVKASGLVAQPQMGLVDSDNESTFAYRISRRAHHNLSRRHCYFNRLYFSVLPLHLLAPIDIEIPDAQLPRGWHCRDCGKLNFRYYLRHLRCGSSYCENKSQRKGYVVEVDRLRDPQDMLPLTLPVNKYPDQADMKVLSWNDHVQTCICKLSSHESRPVVLQHIFTCNLQDLQRDASDLFNEIQVHVPLRRQTDGSNPYFEFIMGEELKLENHNIHWNAIQTCIQNAQNLMNRQGRKYGNKCPTELNIEHLTIRAWVTQGNRRCPDLLCAKDRCIAIMCLGCEVTISISPKSANKNNVIHKPDFSSLIPMENLDGETDTIESEVFIEKRIKDPEVLQSAPSTIQGDQSSTKTVLSISLVHGDVLLLEGDDFEYSLKRTGTTILLFGV